MKLEVGMYVRTKDKRGAQYIRKITSVNETYPEKHYAGIYVDKEIHNVNGVSLKNIVKASHYLVGNIEEDGVLEIGDYVDGSKVMDINKVTGTIYCELGHITKEYHCEIETIVTKEQFESIKYSLEG